MLRLMTASFRQFFRHLGYEITRRSKDTPHEFPSDFDQATIELWRYVRPYTMTSMERVFALCRSVEYVVRHRIPGAFVECGVWRGGSMMAMARTLIKCGATDRQLYLFDTFEGMVPPTAFDRRPLGQTASNILQTSDKRSSNFWGYCPLEDVMRAMQATSYPEGNVVFIKGKVEETLPAHAPARISLLRLDTDWYESTYHELRHLYPLLTVGGVLIIDDYAYWEGAKQAVDEYMAERNLKLLLHRVDSEARICVKLEP